MPRDIDCLREIAGGITRLSGYSCEVEECPEGFQVTLPDGSSPVAGSAPKMYAFLMGLDHAFHLAQRRRYTPVMDRMRAAMS